MVWNYDRTELLTDGIVHVLGLGLAFIGAIVLVVVSCYSAHGLATASVMIYSAGLLAMLGCSAAYNMWPVSPRKWALRRFDHAAIFLFIAATYTPLLAPMNEPATLGLLCGVWLVAALGMALKITLPGRFDRMSIGFYLLLGWSSLLAYQPVVAALPSETLLLIATGGLLYTLGIIFHLSHRLRFQNAIWHGFVLVAALCHYAAIFDCVVIARTS